MAALPRDAAAVTIALVPANLTTQYKDAELRFREAASHDAKREALREMIALLPKHKGTEKLHADLKKRLAKLEEEGEHVARSAAHRADPAHVRREGAGQWVLFGPPNAGKSSLLAALTHAHPEIADYPFTTRAPLPGMMPFEDVQVQLVDTPPVAPGHTEPYLPNLAQGADGAVVVLDPTADDVAEAFAAVLEVLSAATSGRARGPCRPARRRSSRAGRSSSSRRGGTSTTTARSRRSRARPSDRTCRSSRSPPRAATVSTRSGPSSSARSSASASTRRSPEEAGPRKAVRLVRRRDRARARRARSRRRRAPQVRPHLGPRALRRAAGRA